MQTGLKTLGYAIKGIFLAGLRSPGHDSRIVRGFASGGTLVVKERVLSSEIPKCTFVLAFSLCSDAT